MQGLATELTQNNRGILPKRIRNTQHKGRGYKARHFIPIQSFLELQGIAYAIPRFLNGSKNR